MNQAFNEIPFFVVSGSMKGSGARLIATAGNRVANSSSLEVLADLATTLGFVAFDPLGAPTPDPLHSALLHEHFQSRGLVTLPGSEDKGHRLPLSFCSQMQFRAKAALTLA
jgi:hypothetical protein